MTFAFWLIQAVLILAKIFGLDPVAEWSWWAVLSPVLTVMALAGVLLFVLVAVGGGGR